ncbi:hypothetical protein ACFLQJ_00475 [Calditrichota bacterium]
MTDKPIATSASIVEAIAEINAAVSILLFPEFLYKVDDVDGLLFSVLSRKFEVFGDELLSANGHSDPAVSGGLFVG